MRILILLLFVFIFSCSQKNYTWNGKQVTERKFNKELKKHTDSFVRANPEMIELFDNVEFKYDTTTIR